MKKILILLLLAVSINAYSFKQDNLFTKGQCTWFVYGIVQEKLGVKLKFSQDYGRHAKNWPELLRMELHREPRANSIAVYKWDKHGHVVFVESVDGEIIHYRESNSYDRARDGTLKSRHKHKYFKYLRGYLYL